MKTETETKLWLSLFLAMYTAITFLLLIDGTFVQQHHLEYSIVAFSFMMAFGLMGANFLFEGGELPVLENRKYVKYCNLVGPVSCIFVVLLLHDRQPISDCIYWVLLCAPVGSFSLIMMLRPVSTDMGSFYPFCILAFSISLRDYHYSWKTWAAMALSLFLMFTRAHMETRTISAIAARKRALRDAVESSTGAGADA
ncbi:PREDICTED: uncharacterized protein LOC109232444 [Nicotiana attenuata]|uniref:Uncharacterized protein n=1 Tax=Nicotiana attenuata TaxID=49451 RepID=A0A1J6I381_NICAT|nr:PREDICTED: uncharacterized protein LOC109232444 [Nicotiana attenuata]XP_019253758.1 PREDICTED: uncharacterized protein LOC109232444 [Nicotiana attenuata]XP_019253759.1 PREDICTED: uncharacterized protein LOC109232444 [Nicotiana attenuata]XP_019253760.1 PREDICTED: uncharacterized protein LOC109232444 [Nicotiana attenuata]OIS98979.1 hypothetical protein A4A49_11559 [Nicotiana attenuata]